MRYRPRTRRPGVTLLEVLTAIFIMGIGMLAILTLFPIGALSMARAVRDDRAATMAANAASLLAALDLRNDKYVNDGFTASPPGLARPADDEREGPSNIVFVDPQYVLLNGDPFMGSQKDSMNNDVPLLPAAAKFAGSNGVVRVCPAAARDMAKGDPTAANTYAPQGPFDKQINRWFTFQDEIQFEKLGLPVGWSPNWADPPGPVGTASELRRPGTYTWSCMLRRSRYSNPPRAYPPKPVELVEATVIVYGSRNTEVQDGEIPYAVQPVDVIYPPFPKPFPPNDSTPYTNVELGLVPNGTSTIELDHGGTKPNIRRGSWLFDSTMSPAPRNLVNGDWYRVETVTEKTPNVYTIQLDRPVKYPYPPSPPNAKPPFTSMYKAVPTTMVHMQNVIAVLEKATTWNP